MILAVDISGATYIADVGFGGLTLTAPLRLRPGLEQETPHELFRISGEDPNLRVEARIGEDWRPLFRFDLSEQYEVDYAAPNWYLSTNPGSGFRSTLMAARAEKSRRLALRNAEFSIYPLDGAPEKRTLATIAEVKEVLGGPFGIALPAGAELDAALERVLALPEAI
jgi:N-hydroxyarylamine O-acetyltransferase